MRRFIDRFHLWRHDRVDEFEDKFVGWLLFFAVLVIGQDAYTIFTTHQLTWSADQRTNHFGFRRIVMRRSRWAWLLLMLCALCFIGSVPFVYASGTLRASARARFLASAFMLGLGIAAFIYSLIIRKRFARDI
jgi:hypothetical protein